MRNHEGCIRGFYRSTKAYYATFYTDDDGTVKPTYPVDIMIGMYHPDGGSSGEFSIEWDDKLGPRLKVWCDGWSALYRHFLDVLKELEKWDDEEPTEEEVANLLLSLGVHDLTKYSRTLPDPINKFKSKI